MTNIANKVKGFILLFFKTLAETIVKKRLLCFALIHYHKAFP